ncbi:hypothetical protein BGZ76_010817 [Entomortierella beljakovae]|nr:hypothetical protein BGZ76_010817 [Entomortierella beljakovae]
MGQYYELLNISKKQLIPVFSFEVKKGGYVSIDQFATGAKMWEQLMNVGNKPSLALALTDLKYNSGVTNPIAPVGTWSGDRIVLIGDYSEGTPPFITEEDAANPGNYQKVSRPHFFKDEFAPELARLFPDGEETYHLILNIDKKEYLNPSEFTGSPTYSNSFGYIADGIMQGLFSLLFYSTGSSGGDVAYFREGKWAGDHIAIREKSEVTDLDSWEDISKRVIDDIKAHLD